MAFVFISISHQPNGTTPALAFIKQQHTNIILSKNENPLLAVLSQFLYCYSPLKD